MSEAEQFMGLFKKILKEHCPQDQQMMVRLSATMLHLHIKGSKETSFSILSDIINGTPNDTKISAIIMALSSLAELDTIENILDDTEVPTAWPPKEGS